MANEIQMGGPRAPRPQQGMQINITREQMKNAKTITCSCGCKAFIPATGFKEIPGILLGSGTQNQILPIQGLFVCAKCGELAPFIKDDIAMKEILCLNE